MAKRTTKTAKAAQTEPASDLVPGKNEAARAFALAAARIAKGRHCTDIVVLDLRGLSQVTDFFVIGTGSSQRQMQSVADEISDYGRTHDFDRFGKSGYDQSRWVLLDFVDVVVHLFDEEYRGYYDLEMLWGDGARLKIED